MMIVPSDLSGEAVLYTEDASSHVTPVTHPLQVDGDRREPDNTMRR